MARTGTNTNYGTPIAIIIGGALIAGALFFSGQAATNLPAGGGGHAGAQLGQQLGASFRLPEEGDHVRGNPDAAVTIIEFSDFECPFCARLHPSLKRIVEENDDVRWVYRHFPLSQIHLSALGAATASECVAKLGGNDAFWQFADSAFENQHQLGNDFYQETALSLGIDSSAFATCLKDRTVASDVQKDGNEAVQSGGRGTPFAVIVTAGGQLAPFSGALPYEQLVGLVDRARVN